jgi:hypothetical protein
MDRIPVGKALTLPRQWMGEKKKKDGAGEKK